ncbi:MAG: hypothetical protein JXA99_02460 [Candidatus Lokiarchaeota archaeon]|nr:hypothetical protein [Candidatus Lokiarchaeota archaeon]
MEEILNKLELSEESIKLYLGTFGKDILSFQELKLIIPEIIEKNLIKRLNELLNAGLLIQVNTDKDVSQTDFFAIPPFDPILNYFKNIKVSFSDISRALNDLIDSTTKDIFKNNKIELETVYKDFKDIEKDFVEDSLLQKKDAEDISKQMDVIRKIGEIISNIQNIIKDISQTEFSNLIKRFVTLKEELKSKIESLEIRKKKEELLFQILDDTFKDRLGNTVKDFINTLNSMIKQEFNKVPFNEIIENVIHSRDDFKIMLLNLLNSFELNINKISDLINDKKTNLNQSFDELKNQIINKINSIVQKTIKKIENLNDPIITLISESKLKTTSIKTDIIKKSQEIRSLTKIKQYLLSSIKDSKEELLLIIPKIEDYIEIGMFKKLPKTLKIKIASSDPHVNSKVKQFKELNNLEFRKYDKQNFIGIKSDNNLIGFGLIIENKDPMDNFIGISSNNSILIDLLKPSLYKIWSDAEHGSSRIFVEEKKYNFPKVENMMISQEKEINSIGKNRIHIPKSTEPPKNIPPPSDISEMSVEPKNFKLEQEPINTSSFQKQNSELNINESVKFISLVNPKAGDNSGMIINEAFNTLIQNINIYSGETLSQELNRITELILEKRGFSVTLHNIRTTINGYKNQKILLTIEQKNKIFNIIEEWKKRLFT